jgi:hypothetical protein
MIMGAKSFATIYLGIWALSISTGFASPQPLTRDECEASSLYWNEQANVCDSFPKMETGTQPLSRAQCERTNLTWDEQANVCDGRMPGADSAEHLMINSDSAASDLSIRIDKTHQRMRVVADGVEIHNWPVSTGLPRYFTPSGSFEASSMNEIWYSKEWDDAPMPHSIFFTREGHAIHGSDSVKRLGRPASHGCVRLAPQNAQMLFGLVKQVGLPYTEIILTGKTPGGEGVVATRKKNPQQKKREAQTVGSNKASREVRTYREPKKRGILGRLFRGR